MGWPKIVESVAEGTACCKTEELRRRMVDGSVMVLVLRYRRATKFIRQRGGDLLGK